MHAIRKILRSGRHRYTLTYSRSYPDRIEVRGPGISCYGYLSEGVSLDDADLRERLDVFLERNERNRRAAAEVVRKALGGR